MDNFPTIKIEPTLAVIQELMLWQISVLPNRVPPEFPPPPARKF